jgi:hypothetical protein
MVTAMSGFGMSELSSYRSSDELPPPFCRAASSLNHRSVTEEIVICGVGHQEIPS